MFIVQRLRVKRIAESYYNDAQLVLEQIACISSLTRLHLSTAPIFLAGPLSLCSLLPALTRLTVDASRASSGVPSPDALKRLKKLKVRLPNALDPLDLDWYRAKYFVEDPPSVPVRYARNAIYAHSDEEPAKTAHPRLYGTVRDSQGVALIRGLF